MTNLRNLWVAWDAGNHGYFCCLATPVLHCWAASAHATSAEHIRIQLPPQTSSLDIEQVVLGLSCSPGD